VHLGCLIEFMHLLEDVFCLVQSCNRVALPYSLHHKRIPLSSHAQCGKRVHESMMSRECDHTVRIISLLQLLSEYYYATIYKQA
jgi:hypothetical protein